MPRVNWVVFVSGSASVVAQTILIREALALFSGNELVSGVLLCFWLLWAGIGSIFFSSIRLRSDPHKVYVVLLLVLSVLSVISLCFIRVAPRLFALPLGEVVDLGRIILISMLTLAPVCFLFGALFPAASRILPPARVYLFEGLGAFAGGILVSFVLISVLPPFGILLLVVIALLISILFLLRQSKFFFVPLLLLAVLPAIDSIEMYFRRIQMGTGDLIGLEESRYGAIAVTQTGDQYNFYTNGLYDFSYPDLYSSEEAVHYALLLHPGPRCVLLIGGGIGKSIDQIFKHRSVEHVTYVELDPLLFHMGEKYLGQDLRRRDKLTVVFGDARYHVKRTTEQYDVVIVNLPDPANAQINRFYTKEFFAETRRILKPGGLVSVRVAAPANIISPLYGQLLKTIRNTLGSSYANILILPAAKMTFIAAPGAVPLQGIVDTLDARIERRDLDLTYVKDYYYRHDLSVERLHYVTGRIRESNGYVNSDLKPVCYYFTSILWGGIISEPVRKAFVFLFNLPPVILFLPLLLVFFFYRRRSIIYASVLAVGASEISAEVLLIVLFQVFYGYVYGWIGAIVACYMLGLACGVLIYLRRPRLKERPVDNLMRVGFSLTAYFALVIVLALLRPPQINVIIVILVFAAGLLGGMHFPLSVAALERQRAGVVYGVDLIGSSMGALVTAMVLIPVLGIVQTLLVFLVLNLLISIGLATVRSRV
ncbi:hypothetical protein IBX73_00335 [candidate division WOR-3 bacterium]|nr:hypothetical protein [candidate division WOR-3 bacterium]